MKGTNAKGKTGRRYTEAEKKAVLNFLGKYEGRGGISAAQKKYGVSYVALRRWVDGANGVRTIKTSAVQPPREFQKFMKALKTLVNKF